MGLIAIVKEWTRDGKTIDVKCDPGGGFNLTSNELKTAGDDSQPLPGDTLYIERAERTGTTVALAYLDATNEGKAAPGEKRIYARNEITGVSICEIHLKNDQTVEINNAVGSFKLLPSGTINLNGVLIDVDGNVTLPVGMTITATNIDALTSLKVATKEVNGHTHTSTTPGNPTGPF